MNDNYRPTNVLRTYRGRLVQKWEEFQMEVQVTRGPFGQAHRSGVAVLTGEVKWRFVSELPDDQVNLVEKSRVYSDEFKEDLFETRQEAEDMKFTLGGI